MNFLDKPTTEEYLKYLYTEIVESLYNSNGLAIMSMYKSGVVYILKHILFTSELSLPEQQNTMSKYSFGIIESIDEIANKLSFLSLNSNNIQDNKTYDFNEFISMLASNPGKIIYINFSKSFSSKTKIIEFIKQVKGYSRIALLIDYEQIDSLTDLGIYNFAFIKKRNNKDIKILLEKEESWFNYQIGDKNKEKIIDLSDGYAGLTRILLAISNTSPHEFLKFEINKVLSMPQIRNRLDDILNTFTDNTNQILFQLAVGIDTNISPDNYLVKLGVIDFESKLITIKLLQQYLLYKFSISKIDKEGSQLSRSGILLQNLLSNQELILLSYLYDQNSFVSKEAIAEVLWGKNWPEKYSDWAIDKLISRIRKKLHDNDKRIIETFKNKGIRVQR
jgi:hypothetical protein